MPAVHDVVTDPFALQFGETLLKQTWARASIPSRPAWSFGRLGDGRLYLTDRRLIWRRNWWSNFAFLFLPSFDVVLSRIQECRVAGPALAHLFAHTGLVVKLFDGDEVRFAVQNKRLGWGGWFSKSEAEEWCRAISTLLAERRAPP